MLSPNFLYHNHQSFEHVCISGIFKITQIFVSYWEQFHLYSSSSLSLVCLTFNNTKKVNIQHYNNKTRIPQLINVLVGEATLITYNSSTIFPISFTHAWLSSLQKNVHFQKGKVTSPSGLKCTEALLMRHFTPPTLCMWLSMKTCIWGIVWNPVLIWWWWLLIARLPMVQIFIHCQNTGSFRMGG